MSGIEAGVVIGKKYFDKNGSQQYFNQFLKTLVTLVILVRFIHGHLKQCQKKASKINLQQAIVLVQKRLVIIKF